jgi:hypothetical protein
MNNLPLTPAQVHHLGLAVIRRIPELASDFSRTGGVEQVPTVSRVALDFLFSHRVWDKATEDVF